jgi:hypothetical protein
MLHSAGKPLKERNMPDSLTIGVIVLAVLSLVLFLATAAALRQRRYLGTLLRGLTALALLGLAGLVGTLGLAVQGYRALTHEEAAVTVRVEPTGPKQFKAWLRFADGRQMSYDLAGDELYVDAHILKWKPLVNILGLHTAYELDRIAGRYTDVVEERSAIRTVHTLAQDKPLNLFDLRRRYTLLSPLLDADYGSATFIMANEPIELEVRVSTSGLLVRRTANTN